MIIEIVHDGRKCAMIRHADDTITSGELAQIMSKFASGNHWNWAETFKDSQHARKISGMNTWSKQELCIPQ